MNLQGISIIFVIIFLPIFLVSTFYIKNEIDTISMQTSYDAKLIDATTDALSAFEINTANENLSQMEDSLKSMIEASTNIFTTTLATNLGMSGASQNKILPYIPAIVYTLYDGYYIYSPTQSPMVLTSKTGRYVKVGDDGVIYSSGDQYLYYPNKPELKISTSVLNTSDVAVSNIGRMLYCLDASCDPNASDDENYVIKCTINPENAYFTTKYMLKSFTPYTMSYVRSGEKGFDITINYTLDNFIKISGTKMLDGNEVYFTKSGYLIDPQIIDNDCRVIIDSLDLDTDEKIDNYLASNSVTIKFNNKITIRSDESSAISKDYTSGNMVSDNVSAVKYYLKAYAFSKWVTENFPDLSEKDIRTSNTELQDGFRIKQQWLSLAEGDSAKLFYTYGENEIFRTDSVFNFENSESNFYEHKRNVIKNSIQYNLNMAMVAYNAGQGDEYYQMPILSDVEWDNLLSNVSILSFMQGLPCGLKTYNNYAIVTSTNNELLTNLNDIYYIPITNEGDGVRTSDDKPVDFGNALDTAHHLDCMDYDWISQMQSASYFQSFSSKDAKYDKEYVPTKGKFVYDHLANNCYYCIIDNNYDGDLRYIIDYYKQHNGEESDMDGLDEPYGTHYDNIGGYNTIQKLVKAEMIAVAKIKNNTYKSIASLKNYGVFTQTLEEIAPNRSLISGDNKMESANFSLDIPNGCYSIELTLDVKRNSDTRVTDSANLCCGGYKGNSISSSAVQTFVFNVDGKAEVSIEPDKFKQEIIIRYQTDPITGVTSAIKEEKNIYETLAIRSIIYYYK